MTKNVCCICNSSITEYRVIKFSILHKDTKKRMCCISYQVPLCKEHREGSPLEINIEWSNDLDEVK